jgi:hypothetical protein
MALAALAAVAACNDASGPTNGLRLDIALDKDVVALSDSVELTLTLSNVSTRTASVVAADAYGFCYHAFEAFDALGRNVTPPTAFCAAVATIIAPNYVELAPGQHITIHEWWNVSASTVNGVPLPVGLYRVRGAAGTDAGAVHSRERAVQVVAIK